MPEPTFEDLGHAAISGSRRYALRSRHVDQTFQVDIALPATPVARDRSLPVVYVTDGNGTFALAAQTARMLQSGPQPLPPMLVVGIGYRFDRARDIQAQYFETRTRDFTAEPDPAWLEMSRTALAARGTIVRTTTGGAAAFLAFINEELKPFIAARYAVDATDQTLTGMSLGGLFALYVLFNATNSFARYAAFSPAFWWADRKIFRDEAALAARSADFPVRLFLSVGAQEETEAPLYRPVSDTEAMAAILRSRRYRGLKLTRHVFDGEDHMSVYPASISRALRVLFADDI